MSKLKIQNDCSFFLLSIIVWFTPHMYKKTAMLLLILYKTIIAIQQNVKSHYMDTVNIEHLVVK